MKHPVLIPFTAIWFIILFVALFVARTVLPNKKAPQLGNNYKDWTQL